MQSFQWSATGLSLVRIARVPNWNATGPTSGLLMKSCQSRRNHTPPATQIGVRFQARLIHHLAQFDHAGQGILGFLGSSELLSPLWPPASHGSS